MSEEYEHKCARCKSTATAHIGRQDIGAIERHMYVCAKCGLVFGETVASEFRKMLSDKLMPKE